MIEIKEKEATEEKIRRQMERERREAEKRRAEIENERWDLDSKKEELKQKIANIEGLYQSTLLKIEREKEGEKEEERMENLRRIKEEPSELFKKQEGTNGEKIIFRPLPQKPSWQEKVWARALLLALTIGIIGLLFTFWFWYLTIYNK